MHPTLLEIDGWPAIHSYGTLITVGLWLTVPFLVWDLRQRRLSAWLAFDIYIVLIIGAVIGARLGYILTKPALFFGDPSHALAIRSGGQVFFGGALGCFLAAVMLARWRKMAVGTLCDMVLTWGVLAHAFGRLGCFMVGCCYGAPASQVPWAVRFGSEAIVAGDPTLWDGTRTVALHPVQLYETVGLLVIFAAHYNWRVRQDPAKLRPFALTARWAIFYGLLRFCTEFFRGDEVRGLVSKQTIPWLNAWLDLPEPHAVMFSKAQAIALALVVFGAIGLYRLERSEAKLVGR